MRKVIFLGKLNNRVKYGLESLGYDTEKVFTYDSELYDSKKEYIIIITDINYIALIEDFFKGSSEKKFLFVSLIPRVKFLRDFLSGSAELCVSNQCIGYSSGGTSYINSDVGCFIDFIPRLKDIKINECRIITIPS